MLPGDTPLRVLWTVNTKIVAWRSRESTWRVHLTDFSMIQHLRVYSLPIQYSNTQNLMGAYFNFHKMNTRNLQMPIPSRRVRELHPYQCRGRYIDSKIGGFTSIYRWVTAAPSRWPLKGSDTNDICPGTVLQTLLQVPRRPRDTAHLRYSTCYHLVILAHAKQSHNFDC